MHRYLRKLQFECLFASHVCDISSASLMAAGQPGALGYGLAAHFNYGMFQTWKSAVTFSNNSTSLVEKNLVFH